MSEENVEVVRWVFERIQEQIERGGSLVADTTPEGFADDWEWVVIDDVGRRAVWVGQEGFREFFEDWTGEFDEWSIRAERFIDVGDIGVIALTRQSGVGNRGGVRAEVNAGQIYEFEDGRIVRIANYPNHGAALKAAGLRE